MATFDRELTPTPRPTPALLQILGQTETPQALTRNSDPRPWCLLSDPTGQEPNNTEFHQMHC